MKFTQILCKQHIGRVFRRHWQEQRERPIPKTTAEAILTTMGFSVQDALSVVQPKNQFLKIDKPVVPHPDWMDEPCLMYEDHNVLQEGISQACLLTKTIKIDDELPENIMKLIPDISQNVDNTLQRIIYTSTIYDAQQVKLPIVKDINRPSWVFPRTYGITSTRKMYNLSRKCLQFCELLTAPTMDLRPLISDGTFTVFIEKDRDLLQFSLTTELMMMSRKPLKPIADVKMYKELIMPELHPLHHTIGLSKTNIYKFQDLFPLTKESPLVNVHTIFINYDQEKVKNLTELPVTENQLHARSMIKSFTVATACARRMFSEAVKELPEPVVVQCIQSDGQNFHFSVYQLNTLDVNGTDGIRNFWWSTPSIKLYEKAGYENGRPCIEGYNNDVFKKFLAFYKNN